MVLAGCARNAPQDALDPAGPLARSADSLFKTVFWAAVVPIFVIVEGALLFFVLRYRQRSDKDAPVQTHGHTPVEVIWTIIPAAILAVVAVPTIAKIFEFAKRPSGDVLEVTVKAHQWWWEYQYPDLGPSPDRPLIGANELHIPIDRPVLVTLESEDVIHAFWVPRLSGKQDVVPGRKNHLTLIAEEPGEYLGQCAEYCGLSHANMRLKVIAMTQDDFDAWAEAQADPAVEPTDPLAMKGKELFLTGQFAGGAACSTCHVVEGTPAVGKVGPSLTHVASRTTIAGATLDFPGDLEAWLRNPPEEKPGSKMPNLKLTDEEVDALMAYLRGLE